MPRSNWGSKAVRGFFKEIRQDYTASNVTLNAREAREAILEALKEAKLSVADVRVIDYGEDFYPMQMGEKPTDGRWIAATSLGYDITLGATYSDNKNELMIFVSQLPEGGVWR